MCDCNCLKCGWTGLPTERLWEQSDNWQYETVQTSIGSPLPSRIASILDGENGWAGRMVSLERFDRINKRSADYEGLPGQPLGGLPPSIHANRIAGRVSRSYVLSAELVVTSSTEQIGLWIADAIAVWIDKASQTLQWGPSGPQAEIEPNDGQLIHTFTESIGTQRVSMRIYEDAGGGQSLWFLLNGIHTDGEFRYVGSVTVEPIRRLGGVFIRGGGKVNGGWFNTAGTGVTAGCGSRPYVGNCLSQFPSLDGDTVSVRGQAVPVQLESAGWDAGWRVSWSHDFENSQPFQEKTGTLTIPSSSINRPTPPPGVTWPTEGELSWRAAVTAAGSAVALVPGTGPGLTLIDRLGALQEYRYVETDDDFLFGLDQPSNQADVPANDSASFWSNGFTETAESGEILWGIKLQLSLLLQLTDPGLDFHGVTWSVGPNFNAAASYRPWERAITGGFVPPSFANTVATPVCMLRQTAYYRANWSCEGEFQLQLRSVDPLQSPLFPLRGFFGDVTGWAPFQATTKIGFGWHVLGDYATAVQYELTVSNLQIQWPSSITLSEPT